MAKPCIICVAITGSVPTKADNPAVPVTVAEQVESTQAAFEAGASIAHCHVRNDDGTTTSDPERFARLKEGLEKHCPGMVIQFSTGGRSGAGAARGGMLPLKPDMASLSVGSNNFPTRVYENPPDLIDWLAGEMRKYDVKPEIEAFDLSHIHQAVRLNRAGVIPGKLYVQFVMGVQNAMPADRDVFDYYVRTMQRLAPEAEWCAAGIAGTRSRSMNGPSPPVAIPAPGSRTMSGSTVTRWRRRTPRWSPAPSNSAPGTTAPWPPRPRPATSSNCARQPEPAT